MRNNTLQSWTSVVAVWATSLSFVDGQISIEQAQAGGPVRFDVTGGAEGALKVRFEVRRRDGTRTSLPSVVIEPPYPPTGGFFEGPTIPTDAGGGKLVVELVDPESGQVVKTGTSPIGF